MPRFAILTHDWPTLHWDLLLEDGLEADTWRLLQEPVPQGVRATHSPRHRLHYLTYEGPVRGHRGTVTQWDTGTFEWVSRASSQIQISLLGKKLRGEWQIILLRGEDSAEPEVEQLEAIRQTGQALPYKAETTSSLPANAEQVWWFSSVEAAQTKE